MMDKTGKKQHSNTQATPQETSVTDAPVDSLEEMMENDDVEHAAIDLGDLDNHAEKYVQIKETELQALRAELDEAKDRSLRAWAELDNYRKRTNRVMEEDRKYAAMELARAILPVWDNMGRALEAAEKDLHPEAMLDGLQMMSQQFIDILRRHQIEKIAALHQPFDPNIHESIAVFPNAEYPPNTVIIESQAGFRLHDRVVRPTQVVLAAPVPAKSANHSADSKQATSEQAESEQ